MGHALYSNGCLGTEKVNVFFQSVQYICVYMFCVYVCVSINMQNYIHMYYMYYMCIICIYIYVYIIDYTYVPHLISLHKSLVIL